MNRLLSTLLLILFGLVLNLSATEDQRQRPAKMSPWLRLQSKVPTGRKVCAFVRITADADAVMKDHDCRDLASAGNIHIAEIPLNELNRLSADPRVARIEARPYGEILLDTLSHIIQADKAREGMNLPQAFTGRGVVLGSMDIGYDLTHPTFFTRDTLAYRIKCFWDMLSTDTIGSPFPVGRDYRTQEELLALGHSRDGMEQTHGTHTLGIAAGSGYDSPFQGVAPETDLCMVANAVSNNANLIDSALYDRFTFATDALGFKYLFDYARSVQKPCVVTFSEGSSQDFLGYDQLYYEMLDSLVGPGRILVAAAGNQGHVKSWFCKEPGEGSVGSFIVGSKTAYCTLKSSADFTLRLVSYGSSTNDTLLIRGSDVIRATDSLLKAVLPGVDSLDVLAYRSCYDPHDICYDLTFYRGLSFGFDYQLSLEILDNTNTVEFWKGTVVLSTSSKNSRLNAGLNTHNIHSPSSAPRVISVGATTWREGITNSKGEWKHYWAGHDGTRVEYSSMGPTMDGRIKPDVMAPGNNIISSYSSFFREANPTSSDFDWELATSTFRGRVYSWTSNSGTSSSCPAVAGAIALWLQAKPDLTPEEVLGVIRRTSRQPDPSLTYPNNVYGYGEIDVYRGLLDILGLTAITELSPVHTQAVIRIEGHSLVVQLPQSAGRSLRLRLYSLSGQVLHTWSLPSGEARYELPLPHLPSAVYALQLDGIPQVNGSTLVRIGK